MVFYTLSALAYQGITMTIETMYELFEHELKDIYYAEKHLVKTLGDLAKSSQSRPQKVAMREHLKETKEQVKRLKKVFKIADIKEGTQVCHAILGIEKEKKVFDRRKPDRFHNDMFILSSAMKTEHYEIASYQNLIMLAAALKLPQAVDLLRMNMDEEIEALQRLHTIEQHMLDHAAVHIS